MRVLDFATEAKVFIALACAAALALLGAVTAGVGLLTLALAIYRTVVG